MCAVVICTIIYSGYINPSKFLKYYQKCGNV